MSTPATDHRNVAAGFTAVADAVADWDAPAPVEGWTARDVVVHLVTWLPAFLSAGGVALGTAVPVLDDASVQDRFVGFIGRDPAWAPRA